MTNTTPSLFTYIKHYVSRALRETGQALDRVGVRGLVHAHTNREAGDDAYKFQRPLSRHRTRMELLRRGCPKVSETAFIAPCSHLIGSVEIGHKSSVWYGAVLRGDKCMNAMKLQDAENVRVVTREHSSASCNNSLPEINKADIEGIVGVGGGVVKIGNRTNVQDGAVITSNNDHTIIGDGVTIGHAAQIHSSTVESHSLIGMGAILMPGSHISSCSFVAAGALVTQDTIIPSGELWGGIPARKLRDLTQEQQEKLIYQADEYVKLAEKHKTVMVLGGNVSEQFLSDMERQFLEGSNVQSSTESQVSEDKNELKIPSKADISQESNVKQESDKEEVVASVAANGKV